MIDIENAKNEFIKYVDTYKAKDEEKSKIINFKFTHSFRVMKNSLEIAKSLNLSKEQIDLATLIGLLHDIARFEEVTRFSNLDFRTGFDHGDYGVEILEKDNFIRKFIKTDKYDYIIKKAIINHNKFKIEDGLDEETMLQCRIIRDADKLDILFESIEVFWNSKNGKSQIEKSSLSDSYYEQFINKTQVYRVPEQSLIDEVISYVAFIFDLNFEYSFEKLQKEGYILKILNSYEFEDKKTEERINKIKEVSKEYIQENLPKIAK